MCKEEVRIKCELCKKSLDIEKACERQDNINNYQIYKEV